VQLGLGRILAKYESQSLKATRTQVMMFMVWVHWTATETKHKEQGRGSRLHATEMQYLMRLSTDQSSYFRTKLIYLVLMI